MSSKQADKKVRDEHKKRMNNLDEALTLVVLYLELAKIESELPELMGAYRLAKNTWDYNFEKMRKIRKELITKEPYEES